MDRPRKFNLSDAIVLVAATAIGLAWVQSFLEDLGVTAFPDALILRLRIIGVPTCLLVSLSLAILVLRFRQPRPHRHRLALRPGTATCLAVAVVVGYDSLGLASHYVGDYIRYGSVGIPLHPFGTTVNRWAIEIGGAVTTAWLMLAIGGRWRPEPGWIDRMGRLVGVCWISLSFITEFIAEFIR